MGLRKLTVLAACSLVAVTARAGLERDLKQELLGAWVLTGLDTRSDCGGMYTNNRIRGLRSQSKGRLGFAAGELARIDKLDVNRKRVDVLLTLDEPVLLAYPDGPFTLYREAGCRVELEVEMDRQTIKDGDPDAIAALIDRLLERHDSRDAALASAAYNGREREPYPDDYQQTLHAHAVWQAQQANAAVQARLDEALTEATRVADRLESDPDYLAGLAEGVAAARALDLRSCPAMMGASFSRPAPPRPGAAPPPPEKARFARGRSDGFNLVLGLALQRGLAGCFVPVPEQAATGEPTGGRAAGSR